MPATAMLLRIFVHDIPAPFLWLAPGGRSQFQVYRRRHAQPHFVMRVLDENANFIHQAGAQFLGLDRLRREFGDRRNKADPAGEVRPGKLSELTDAFIPRGILPKSGSETYVLIHLGSAMARSKTGL